MIFSDIKIKPSEIPKLRGFIANKFKGFPQLHHHLPGGKFNYGFPKIQYRILNNKACIIAFSEGFEILKKILFETEKILISDTSYTSNEKMITLVEEDFGATEQCVDYMFISPWMALNEDNYKKYVKLNTIDKQRLLKRILKNNLKTLSKGFDYWIKDFDNIQIEGYFKPLTVNFKNQKMICFKGNFTTNFLIPDLLGLGKQSARGFGVVKKIK